MFKLFFDSNEKQINRLKKIVTEVNTHEAWAQSLSPEEVKQQTHLWQDYLLKIPEDKLEENVNNLLPKAFALVREAGKRTLNMRHFDVQVLAGIVLHQGKIAEQKTGEGKTLTATLPLYLNALTGKGVHLVTPNDYLSRHGAGWMGTLYDYLGIKVGVVIQERAFVYDASYQNTEFEDAYAVHLKEVTRQEAYKCDVVYGTNHEFGFDYLRDNMVRSLRDMVQINPRGESGAHYFAIVDEVDSILIDMARTPLIISTTDSRPSTRYMEADRIIKSLSRKMDYEVDEKFRNVSLTDLGVRRVERLLNIENLYEQDFEMVHLLEQALTAHALYEKDRDYVVKEGKVIIVDQFTGRLLPSNRFSHGLHQAIEAKEDVAIQEESKTLAEVSYQNYFRMYRKLAGMTGTAITEAEEFYKIYHVDVLVIPTNKDNIRKDANDVVYKSEAAKFKAIANEIEERHKLGQPVLVGTTSVEKSEMLHGLLKRRGIPHEILNAKNHEKEATFIAQAGKKGAVIISTNMAGRGVDIVLGGDPVNVQEQEEVKSLGGLFVIGTERHESRRIDNQLRGRAGRQGDPGASKFFISLQDDLMRIFGGDRITSLMDRFGLDENIPLEAGIVSKSIENAQKRVEGFNFDRRKQLVEMDDVLNTHREVIYKLRRRILDIERNNEESITWLLTRLSEYSDFKRSTWDAKSKLFPEGVWEQLVLQLSLPVIDYLWMEHLVDMDQVREGIGLRGYAQKDPMVEYKREGHERFGLLVSKVYAEISERLTRVEISVSPQEIKSPTLNKERLTYQHSELESGVKEELSESSTVVDNLGRSLKVVQIREDGNKVGRNDACPCGSGKKYKNCHMNR